MTEQTTNTICPSCSSIITGMFCSNCGERQISHRDFSLSHFIEEGIETFTHIDNNKLLNSLKLLITKPGILTKNYFNGRRMPFMKPLQLFIVCNLLFFFLLGKSNLLAIQFYGYKTFDPYISFGSREMIAKKAISPKDLARVAVVFNERMATQSKTFIIFFIPVFAIGSALLFYNRKKYLSEHLVFATHLFSFLLIYFIVFRYVAQLPFHYFTKQDYNSTFDLTAGFLNIAVLSIYFSFAARNFYFVSKTRAILSSVLIAIIFILSIFAYRMLLFYKIIHSIH